jgi:hypothetical protein
MLIRNVNSIFELENLKKQQASILQLQIDNEAIKEKRVADFKNPNKPPPIPEQYKTASEIQKDVMSQQKITIDHLKSLGLDNFLASQVAVDMSQLTEGDGAYFKFNSYFPAFKKKIDNNRILKTLVESSQIIALIKIFFNEIDESTGLSVDASTSTNYFDNSTRISSLVFPSKQLIERLGELVTRGYQKYENIIDKNMVFNLSQFIAELASILPLEEQIDHIDALPNIERTKINKEIQTLVKKYGMPSSISLTKLANTYSDLIRKKMPDEGADFGIAGLNEEASIAESMEEYGFEHDERKDYENYKIFIGRLKNYFENFNPKTVEKLNEINELLKVNEGKVNEFKLEVDAHNPKNQLKFITNQIKVASQNYLARNVENFARNDVDYFPEDGGYDENSLFQNYFYLTPPTIDGNPPNGATDAEDNIMYEEVKVVKNRKTFTGNAYLRNGQRIQLVNGEYQLLPYFNQIGEQWEQPLRIQREQQFIDAGAPIRQPPPRLVNEAINEEDNIADITQYLMFQRQPDRAPEMRYTKAELEQLILKHELPNLKLKLGKDDNYQPMNIGESRFYSERDAEGNPVMTGNTQGWGIKPKQKKRKPKKKDSSSDGSSDEEKKMRDIHIDINSHNGKDYKMSGDGFIKRRIKIGKGLELRNDEPKFRQFGKYIIHMPQLRNNNILNLKHKSGGSIPSIKPVHVDDNYKEFVIDILDSGRVNDKHYKSLTEPEQNHFLKAVRGAGMIDFLKLKTSNYDKEQEDIKRLELLLGEVNAGNDNAGILKEARTLIKRYVSNGRISRQKGLDMLLELE